MLLFPVRFLVVFGLVTTALLPIVKVLLVILPLILPLLLPRDKPQPAPTGVQVSSGLVPANPNDTVSEAL